MHFKPNLAPNLNYVNIKNNLNDQKLLIEGLVENN
jgi:hypothetical protein